MFPSSSQSCKFYPNPNPHPSFVPRFFPIAPPFFLFFKLNGRLAFFQARGWSTLRGAVAVDGSVVADIPPEGRKGDPEAPFLPTTPSPFNSALVLSSVSLLHPQLPIVLQGDGDYNLIKWHNRKTTRIPPTPLSVTSLTQGHSSSEDEGPVSPTNDVFGLASLPAAKKPRMEPPKPASVIPHSAPDMLSEVHQAFGPFRP